MIKSVWLLTGEDGTPIELFLGDVCGGKNYQPDILD